MESKLRDYNDAINDCINTLSRLYESTCDANIYNAKVKSALEKLKAEYEKYPYMGVPRKKETRTNDEPATEYNAPPLGLCPRRIHEQRRMNEIKEAVKRYFEANQAIPIEWITEYNELREKESWIDSLASMNQ